MPASPIRSLLGRAMLHFDERELISGKAVGGLYSTKSLRQWIGLHLSCRRRRCRRRCRRLLDEKHLRYARMIPERCEQTEHSDKEGHERHPEGCPAGDREVPECEEKQEEAKNYGRDTLRSACPR